MEYKVSNVLKKIIFAFVIIAAIMLLLMSQANLKEIWEVIKTSNWQYLLIALGVLVAYFVLNLVGMYILTKYKRIKLKTRDIVLIGGTEPFFNGITPFATGGQPFQAYAMFRKGVPLKDSTSVLVMNFITFMISTNIFAIISLIYYGRYTSQISNLAWIVIMGFTINFLVLVLMFSLALSNRLRGLCSKAIQWLASKKPFQKLLAGRVETFNNYFDGMQAGCKELLSKPLVFIGCILSKLASLVFFYAIPFYVLKAINSPITYNDFIYVILGTSFATTMVVWVPTPGGTGGMELAFHSIFLTIAGMTPALATGGMVLWRLYTYYLLMVVGFIFYILLEIFDGKERKKNQLLKAEGDKQDLNVNEANEATNEELTTSNLKSTTPNSEEARE